MAGDNQILAKSTRSAAIPRMLVLALFCVTAAHADLAPWVTDGGQVTGQYGLSTASAGDVNGDGYGDIIVGAPFYANGQNREGRAVVYYGTATGLSYEPGWTYESDRVNAEFGTCVAGAGDVNNDGYDDVVIGSYRYSNGETNEGSAFLFLGSASGLATSAAWTAEANQTLAFLGYSVAGAGDVNNDGYDDVIVGAFWYDKGQTNEGRAYVYFGSATGLTATPSWTAESDIAGAEFGYSVAGAGDINNDGYDDILVGAHLYNGGQIDEGRAYAFYGSASGPATSPNWTYESNQADARLGFSLSAAGDVNGDNYDDVIIGAYRYDHGETNEGRAFVFHGAGSGLSTTPSWIVEGDQDWCYFGYSVSSAGDVNLDGFDDVIVGVYWFENEDFNEGGARIYYGTELGLLTIPGWTQESDQDDAGFGCSVANAGDVNGDGYLDVLLGANLYDNGEADEGRAYVFYGTEQGVIQGPKSPEIATDGGNGIGADFIVNTPVLHLVGTVVAAADQLLVNGSASGVTYTPGGTTWSLDTALVEGPNLFLVIAVDPEGRASIPDRIVVTLDTSLPDAPVITTNGGNGPGADFATNMTDILLTGTCDTGIVEMRVNGETTGVTFTPNTTSWVYSGTLTGESNRFEVTSVDNGDNISPPAVITITLDTAAPSAPIITTDGGNGTGADFITRVAELTLEGSCSTETDQILVNGSTSGVIYAPGTTNWYASITLIEGANVLPVAAMDSAGNVSAADAITITLDLDLLNPPIITTNGGKGSGVSYSTNNPALLLEGVCETGAHSILVNDSAQGVTYTAGQTTWSYTGTLAEGKNLFSVTAINADANASLPDRIEITLDTAPPATPVITTNGGADFDTAGSTVLLTGTCSTDTLAVLVNGSSTGVTRVPGSTSWSYSASLVAGANSFDVTAQDTVGNISSPDSIIVTRDNDAPPAPIITTNNGENYTTNLASVSLIGTCDATSALILVNGSTSGVTYTAGATTWLYTGTLILGENTLTVTSRDALSNVSEADSITVTYATDVDPEKLATSITIAADENKVLMGESFSINGTMASTPPTATPGLQGLTITLRYDREGIPITERTVTLGAQHTFADTYVPASPGAWTVHARFSGNENFLDSGWSQPANITVESQQPEPSSDINGDGKVSAVDVQLVINAALDIDITPYSGDVNGDTNVNAQDIQIVINSALGL